MRVKDLWKFFPLPSKIRLVWDRLTLTKTTTVYFAFSILHCVVQVAVQVHAFQNDVHTADFLASITEQGNVVIPKSFYVFEDGLRLCNNSVPTSFSASSCQLLWDGTVGNGTSMLPPPAEVPMNTTSNPSPTCYPPTTIGDAQDWDPGEQSCNDGTVVKRMPPDTIESVGGNGTVQVVLNGPGQNGESVNLDRECLLVLGWPVQILQNTEREDLIFILFQIWVLGMSIVAILNESVPHMIATLLTHLVATAWAGFQIFNTAWLRGGFAAVITNGACRPADLLQTYWESRASDELSSLISNFVALLVSASLCWKLAKSFSWQTFKRIGTSLAVSRSYKIVLTLSIVIQLSLFFILTSIALWLDQLWNGAIARLATWPLYRLCLIITLILLPPWLAFGWYSVRREHKIMTSVFLVMCCGYLAGWGAMFHSITFHWTYITWPFFAAMTTTSVILTLLAFILGLMCRINFGKGLPHYLKEHEPVEEGFDAVITGDLEKAASSKMHDYAAPFGGGIQFMPQPQVQPMDMKGQAPLRQPSRAVTRTPSERTHHSIHRESSHGTISSSETCV